jgi:hypothetical protein
VDDLLQRHSGRAWLAIALGWIALGAWMLVGRGDGVELALGTAEAALGAALLCLYALARVTRRA